MITNQCYIIGSAIGGSLSILLIIITLFAVRYFWRRRLHKFHSPEVPPLSTTTFKKPFKNKSGVYKKVVTGVYDTASELEDSSEDETGYFSEDAAAKLAVKKSGNLLRTNFGQVCNIHYT